MSQVEHVKVETKIKYVNSKFPPKGCMLKYRNITLIRDTYSPPGWPEIAAFQNLHSQYLIFRSFGQIHCRLLLNLQAEIEILDKALSNLDKRDEARDLEYKLRSSEHQDGWDCSTKNILRELEDKVLKYGKWRIFIDG
jgi:hypothetical protein